MALGGNLKKKQTTKSAIQAVETVKEVVSGKPSATHTLPIAEEDTVDGIQSPRLVMVVFYLGDERYALPIEEVKEVVPAGHITSIPQAPDFVLGMANVRGNVYGIFDIGAKMAVATEVGEALAPHFVVLDSQIASLALFVQGIPTAITVYESSIDRSSDLVAQHDQDYSPVEGIIKENGEVMILLSPDRILNALENREV